MKKLIFVLVLALAGIVRADYIGEKLVTDTIKSNVIFAIDATGLDDATPDSVHIATRHLGAADTMVYFASYASWGAFKTSGYADTTTASNTGGYKYVCFKSVVSSIDGSSGNGLYDVTITVWSGSQPTFHSVGFDKVTNKIVTRVASLVDTLQAVLDTLQRYTKPATDSLRALLDSIQTADEKYVILRDSSFAALDTLQRFAKATTDSLQAVLDSLQLADAQYIILRDSIFAVLDSTQRFTKVTTDSIQAVLDSLQLADEKYVILRDSLFATLDTLQRFTKPTTDSVNAILDSLQRFTKATTDSIQALLDSIQLQDGQYTILKDSLYAVLDTLQRFTKPTTDTLQIVMDSLQSNVGIREAVWTRTARTITGGSGNLADSLYAVLDTLQRFTKPTSDSVQAILDSLQLADAQYIILRDSIFAILDSVQRFTKATTDSLNACLDTLQRFTKRQTDSLQAVLDSIQTLDEKYTDLNDDSSGAGAGGGITASQADSVFRVVYGDSLGSLLDSTTLMAMIIAGAGSATSNWTDALRDSLMAMQTRSKDSMFAALDTLQRFTKRQTDTLQAVLDSIQSGVKVTSMASNIISTATIAEGTFTPSRFSAAYYTAIADTTDNRAVLLTSQGNQNIVDSLDKQGFLMLADSNTIQKLIADTTWTDSRRITPTKVVDTMWAFTSTTNRFTRLSDSSAFQGAAAGLTKGDIIDTFLAYDDGGNHFALLSDSLSFQGSASSLTATKVKDTVMAAIEDTTSGYGLWLRGYLADIADDSTTTTDVDYGKIADTIWSANRAKDIDNVLNNVAVVTLQDGAIKWTTFDDDVYDSSASRVWEWPNTGSLGLTGLGYAVRNIDLSTDGSGGDGIENNIQNVMDAIALPSYDSSDFAAAYWDKMALVATGAEILIATVNTAKADSAIALYWGDVTSGLLDSIKVMDVVDSSVIEDARVYIYKMDGSAVVKYHQTTASGRAEVLLDTTLAYQIVVTHNSYQQKWDTILATSAWMSAPFEVYMTAYDMGTPGSPSYTRCYTYVNQHESGKPKTGYRLTAIPNKNVWVQSTDVGIYLKAEYTAVSDTTGLIKLDLLQSSQVTPVGTDSLKYTFKLEKIGGGGSTSITPPLRVPDTTPFRITGWK